MSHSTQQNPPQMQDNNNNNQLAWRRNNNQLAIRLIQDTLLKLIETPGTQGSFKRNGARFVPLGLVPRLCRKMFGVVIDPAELGYASLLELVEVGLSVSEIVVHRLPYFCPPRTTREYIGRRDAQDQQHQTEAVPTMKKASRRGKRLDDVADKENTSTRANTPIKKSATLTCKLSRNHGSNGGASNRKLTTKTSNHESQIRAVKHTIKIEGAKPSMSSNVVSFAASSHATIRPEIDGSTRTKLTAYYDTTFPARSVREQKPSSFPITGLCVPALARSTLIIKTSRLGSQCPPGFGRTSLLKHPPEFEDREPPKGAFQLPPPPKRTRDACVEDKASERQHKKPRMGYSTMTPRTKLVYDVATSVLQTVKRLRQNTNPISAYPSQIERDLTPRMDLDKYMPASPLKPHQHFTATDTPDCILGAIYGTATTAHPLPQALAVVEVQDKCDIQVHMKEAPSTQHLSRMNDTVAGIQVMQPSCLGVCDPLSVSNDMSGLLALLPIDLAAQLANEMVQKQTSEIVLDFGRKPLAWVNGHRMFLGGKERLISRDEVQTIAIKLGITTGSRRAKMDGQLHRIASTQNTDGDTIGISMRIRRHFAGSADIIADLLREEPAKSILLLGEAGTGKTTILRDVARILAAKSNVVVVDTTNDIAGDSDVAHASIGLARRVMVPSPAEQSRIVVECLQDSSHSAIVIDEFLSYSSDLEAAQVCRRQGVQIVTSAACGSLRNAIQCPNLRQAFGVKSDDETCHRAESIEDCPIDGQDGARRIGARRVSPPMFDCVMEATGNVNEWRVVTNTADAVDRILDGGDYIAQKRTRNPETGNVQLDFEHR